MKITAIVTVYNKAPYLRKCLDSMVMQQLDCDYEILIAEDCSTDGSREIAEEYCSRYPQLVRGLFQEKNAGINQNWKQAVRMSDADYIARIDGDDYWTDPRKLQKQLDLLRNTPDSDWCVTDFDLIDEEDRILQKSVLANGHLPRITRYEDMLLSRGFMAPSSWLCEGRLLAVVTELIPEDAVDDTFCMQMDMFYRTKMTVLEENTCIYRMQETSDSHSKDSKKMEERLNRLADLQVMYFNRYPSLDREYMLRELFAIQRERDDLFKKLAQAQIDRDNYRKSYESVVGSTAWKMTAPIRRVLDKIKNV